MAGLGGGFLDLAGMGVEGAAELQCCVYGFAHCREEHGDGGAEGVVFFDEGCRGTKLAEGWNQLNK